MSMQMIFIVAVSAPALGGSDPVPGAAAELIHVVPRAPSLAAVQAALAGRSPVVEVVEAMDGDVSVLTVTWPDLAHGAGHGDAR